MAFVENGDAKIYGAEATLERRWLITCISIRARLDACRFSDYRNGLVNTPLPTGGCAPNDRRL